MTTIRMVSDKEGEEIRNTTEEKANKLRNLLVGAVVTDVKYKTTWMNQRPIESIAVEKNGKTYLLTVESESSWGGSTIDWLEVENMKTREVISGECGQP
jgi:hypothetical protein